MSNNYLIISLVLATLALAGCKKNYTCTCTYNFKDPNGVNRTGEYEFYISKSKKDEASEECTTFEEDNTNSRYTYECSTSKL